MAGKVVVQVMYSPAGEIVPLLTYHDIRGLPTKYRGPAKYRGKNISDALFNDL
jgi:hypothetical protein